MRKILIVGNWKMHLNVAQASLLVHRLQERIKIHRDIEVVLAPTMLTLQPISLQIDRRKFRLAAQNAYSKDEGPYTGEVSFTMLRDIVHYVIIGHSERRRYFHEDLEAIRDKVTAAVRNEITPVLCIGETKNERDEGEAKQVWHDQLMATLSDLTAEEVGEIVICYEPVWAISNGKDFSDHALPKPSEVAQAVGYIRGFVKEVYGQRSSKDLRVIYGGSASADMVHGFLDVEGVDGFLPGGASLNYEAFSNIVDAAHRWQRDKAEDED